MIATEENISFSPLLFDLKSDFLSLLEMQITGFISGVKLLSVHFSIPQKKLSQVWLITPWLPKSFLRIRLKHLVKSIKREDAAIKKEGLVNLQEDQLKAVREISDLRIIPSSSPTLRTSLDFIIFWWLLAGGEKQQNRNIII